MRLHFLLYFAEDVFFELLHLLLNHHTNQLLFFFPFLLFLQFRRAKYEAPRNRILVNWFFRKLTMLPILHECFHLPFQISFGVFFKMGLIMPPFIIMMFSQNYMGREFSHNHVSSHFLSCLIFPLNYPILLKSPRSREVMSDAMIIKNPFQTISSNVWNTETFLILKTSTKFSKR